MINDSLGMALTKVLLEHEPTLKQGDMEAAARAAIRIANLLGCIMAAVIIKEPETYEEALKLIMEKVDISAQKTAEMAVREVLRHRDDVTTH